MQHRFLSTRYWQAEETPMGSSGDLVYAFDDVINLSLGDPDVTTDQRIIDAAFADASAGATHYTDFYGEPQLRHAIVDFYAEEYGLSRSIDEIMVTTSGCHAMWLVMEAILDDGDEVIITEPYFTPYPQQITLARGVPVICQTTEENRWQVDPEALEKLITERTKAIIVNTPGNPTGSCFSRATLEKIADIAVKHDLVIVADDIYTAFSYAEPFVPMASIPAAADRTITISSFSKNYAMTGWRIGYVLAPDFVVQTLKDINENNVFTAPSISQRAAYHALAMRHELQPALIAEYRARSEYCYERVQATPNMSTLAPQGAIYLWVNIAATGLTDLEVADRLLREAHVLVIPGTAFGPHCSSYIRLAMCVGKEQIAEAFDRIAMMTIFRD